MSDPQRIYYRFRVHGIVALFVISLLMIGRFEVWGSSGYLALHAKQQEYERELQHLKQLEDENKQLHHDITRLKSDPESIEQIAREELHLTKPNEVVFTFPDEPADRDVHTKKQSNQQKH